MFGKSLFKQSCKANGTMWIIITVAVCFMLSCVMLIAGNGDLGDTKVVIEDAIVEGELTAQTQGRAIEYYSLTDETLRFFDSRFQSEFAAFSQENDMQKAIATAYTKALFAVKNEYYPLLLSHMGYASQSVQAQELMGIVFYSLNPPETDANGIPTGKKQFDDFFDYGTLGIAPPDYTVYLSDILNNPQHAERRQKYAMTQASIFLAGNMIKEENVTLILNELSQYHITPEKFHDFGFDDFSFIRRLSENTVVNYRANFAYRWEHKQEDETEESIKQNLTAELACGLLSALPDTVSDALKEIGAADLYGTLVGSIFFKMAGLLLPIIYMIMTANALIAGQVDSGSMAYILATGTKRKEVAFTQAMYLIGSLLAMFLCTTLTSVICFAIVDVNTKLTYGKLLLINVGAFFVLFAMSGICFLASCVFNRSKHSMASGGGLNMFFLVATMLGLFGSPVLPSIIRMKALNTFNYVTIISLFDVVSILEGTLTYLWKWGILVAIGIICYVAGSVRFAKKDLPL